MESDGLTADDLAALSEPEAAELIEMVTEVPTYTYVGTASNEDG